MVDNPDSPCLQYTVELRDVVLRILGINVNEGVPGPNMVNALLRQKVQAGAVVDIIFNIGTVGEAFLAQLDAPVGDIDEQQTTGDLLQGARPAARPRTDFHDGRPGLDPLHHHLVDDALLPFLAGTPFLALPRPVVGLPDVVVPHLAVAFVVRRDLTEQALLDQLDGA